MAAEGAQVIVIGGGVIGLSIACHLGRLGISDVLLLERERLTSGTSWHAAGIVGPLRASMNLTRLAKYALELFVELESKTGQATGYRQTGGVWLAQRTARMQELRRIKAMGDRSGLDTEMLTAAEISRRLPLLRADDLAGGLWVEQDGQVNPVDLCMAYAHAARSAGVEIREHSRVVDIDADAGAVRAVLLADGSRIACRKLVICAGAWSRQLAAHAGVDLPIAACEHMYVVTELIDGLPEPCPIIRDLDSGIYLKGDSGKLLLGAFEANPKPWVPSPEDAGFLTFDEDWEHAQPMLEAGIWRAPILAEHGITHFMNGPESFSVDTRQIMGESPQCRNLFVAAGFNSIGIMSSAGVGKVMADWVHAGEAPMDLWEVDIARLDPLLASDACLAQRIPEAVHNQFAMHWPYKQYRSARDLRRSPWHDALERRGAVFGAPTGWERPLWYATDAAEAQFEYGYGSQCWWPAAQREARHCQRSVSLFELSPFAKFEISGLDALNFLQGLCSNNIDIAPGLVRYSLMLNRRGGIESEITVMRLDSDRFLIVGDAASRFKDYYWLRRHLDAALQLRIDDVTEKFAVVGIMGPGSRKLLQGLADIDFGDSEFPFSSLRRLSIDNCELLAVRLSFVGELGWELYIPVARAAALMETILRVGAGHDLGLAGHFALDACRLEVGFRHWGHDIGADDTPFEAGLGFVVELDKPGDFNGRDALRARQREGWSKQLRLCEVVADSVLILHDEPVYLGGEIVGHCTSGGRGFRTGKSLCFVLFYRQQQDMAKLQIDIAGEKFELKILAEPPYRARSR
jgi:4-methylaminobutanoate oxidase (formaldehyde-forming)